jgi:hypothetical protein
MDKGKPERELAPPMRYGAGDSSVPSVCVAAVVIVATLMLVLSAVEEAPIALPSRLAAVGKMAKIACRGLMFKSPIERYCLVEEGATMSAI